ncbi:alkaline phosphatase D family protein [Tengunoibacter tsumagoiensis]|uniref:Metallophosphatase n=1 Tax=Tengunoibacter tsumagoiensis TaxID=2014871 RepID=A0A401ZYE5_9CHLR|nr:alkaline phosphatase D family protein [Tengunoibacter tsumagoiensis]GCE11853.1 metallophosphatase [Tengunoibacter tsumagoiensis]
MLSLRVGPLVRAVSESSVVIWAELTEYCLVTCSALSLTDASTDECLFRAPTTQVGERFYVAIQLTNLHPSTWYSYTLSCAASESEPALLFTPECQQCFRTLDHSLLPDQRHPLRIAYGSCRKANLPASDTFNALGEWLIDHYEQRDTIWPHLLLLIGDQIYADQVPDQILLEYPHLQQGASTFHDFALLYTYAWSYHSGARQALACLPTYMMFDDHEITNNWNTEPNWRDHALHNGLEQTLVDGEVAYWVYQGWGNLDQQTTRQSPLFTIMQEAALRQEDALPALRDCIKADVYRKQLLRWHYEIPTQPPLFVANARTERTALFPETDGEQTRTIYDPTRIMSPEQQDEIAHWLAAHDDGPAILVSSVPVLMPPAIGMAEYLMGKRLWLQAPQPFQWLGKQLALFQQKVSSRMSFDHWPLYSESWAEMVSLLTRHHGDILLLSGDVHFSYAIEAQQALKRRQNRRILQFVSTPMQNQLDADSQQKIRLQSRLSQTIYGGLWTHTLPLQSVREEAQIYANLLFQNTLALLTIQPDTHKGYTFSHEYLGIVEEKLEIIARTQLPAQQASPSTMRSEDRSDHREL